MATSSENKTPNAFFNWVIRPFFEAIGAPIVTVTREFVGMFRVFGLTLYYILRSPIRWKETFRQAYSVGNQSFVFVSVVLGFMGMIMVYQSGYQAQKIVGDLSLLGAIYLRLMVREFAPTITAMMLATRVGTGIAAEIGSMVVTEQVDALRMNNAEPIQYLVVPRFIATVVMTVVLSIISIVVSFLTGMMIAKSVFGVNPSTFYNTDMLAWGDIILFLMKATAYGMAIPVIAAEAGLGALGGSEGVGWATTKSVVNASLMITFLDFILSGFAYAVLF